MNRKNIGFLGILEEITQLVLKNRTNQKQLFNYYCCQKFRLVKGNEQIEHNWAR